MSRVKKKLYLLFLLILSNNILYSQQKWSLQNCIDQIGNNIDLREAKINLKSSEINLKQTKISNLPSITTSFSHIYNFGYIVDPLTNNKANNDIRSDYASISLKWTIYNHFKHRNNNRRAKVVHEIDKLSFENTKLVNKINIIKQFFDVLMGKELVKIGKNNLIINQNDYDFDLKIQKQNRLKNSELLNSEINLNNSKIELQEYENNLKSKLILLKKTMGIDENVYFDIVDFYVENTSMIIAEGKKTIIEKILSEDLSKKIAEKNIEVSNYDIKMAKSEYFPKVSLIYKLNTFYSHIQGTEDILTDVFGNTTNSNYGILNQFDDNLEHFFSISVSIPIFNGFNAKYTYQKAKINKELSELNLNRINQDSRDYYSNLVNNFFLLKKKVKISEKNLDNNKQLFEIARTSYKLKKMTYLDFDKALLKYKNNQIQFLRNKYDYLVNKKVFEILLSQ